MSSRDSARSSRTSRSRSSRWNDPNDMDISNSDDERDSRRSNGRTSERIRDSVRDGILFTDSNYYQFTLKFVSMLNTKLRDQNLNGPQKELLEKVTPASRSEQIHINLPEREKSSVQHCDMTISGLPPSVFFGSGYGSQRKTAHFAAAKDLMDKMLKIGFITRDLHEAVGLRPELEQSRRLPDFNRAVDVIFTFDSLMSREQWPYEVMLSRQVSPSTLAQLEAVMARAREAIYGRDAPVYDERACQICKRAVHSENCPMVAEEKKTERLMKDQDDRKGERRRSRSGERRGGDKERKETERKRIEAMIMEQRAALEREESALKMKEAAERQRAAAMAFGGGSIPAVGGPGAVPLMTPGMSTSTVPPPIPHLPMMGLPGMMPPPPFMMMAEMAALNVPGYGKPPLGGQPSTIPNTYAQHVRMLEEQSAQQRRMIDEQRKEAAMAVEAARMAALREEQEALRMKAETELRAEMEAQLQAEIEAKRAALEEEIKQRLAPREARRLGHDVTSAYGAPPGVGLQSSPTIHSSSFYPGISMQCQPSMDTLTVPQLSMMPPPELDMIKKILAENGDLLHNLQFAKDRDILLADPVLQRIGQLGNDAHLMGRPQLQQLLADLQDFLARLQRRATEGRRMPQPVQREEKRRRSRSRSRDRRDRRRDRSRSKERRRERSRSTSRDRRRREMAMDEVQEEVLVQVGAARFRQLKMKEALGLNKGELVVAQDMKSGRWSTAKVARVTDRRVHLVVGNAQWKKELNEIYKPIE